MQKIKHTEADEMRVEAENEGNDASVGWHRSGDRVVTTRENVCGGLTSLYAETEMVYETLLREEEAVGDGFNTTFSTLLIRSGELPLYCEFPQIAVFGSAFDKTRRSRSLTS